MNIRHRKRGGSILAYTTAVLMPAIVSMAFAAPLPPKIQDDAYYPSRVGTKWVYRLSDDEELIKTVSKVEDNGNGKVLVVNELHKDGTSRHHETVKVTPFGIFLVEMGYAPGIIDPPLCELQFPIKT